MYKVVHSSPRPRCLGLTANLKLIPNFKEFFEILMYAFAFVRFKMHLRGLKWDLFLISNEILITLRLVTTPIPLCRNVFFHDVLWKDYLHIRLDLDLTILWGYI